MGTEAEYRIAGAHPIKSRENLFCRSLPELYQSHLLDITPQTEKSKCKRGSWASIISRVGKADLFAGFNRDSFDRISSESIPSSTAQPADVQAEARINDFVGSYRSLPFQVRAKLENWAINPEELLLLPSSKSRSIITSDGRGKAMYHGLEVDVRFLRASGETLSDSSAQNEIQALSHMRHPNIIGFLGTCALGQLRFIVTESMSLGSLESLVLAHKAKRPSWRPAKADTLAWSLGLVRAVNYMHQSDPCIVHRRLSPAILLMAPGGVLKVSGFEFCSRAAGSPPAPAPTHQHPECMVASAPTPPPAGAPGAPGARGAKKPRPRRGARGAAKTSGALGREHSYTGLHALYQTTDKIKN